MFRAIHPKQQAEAIEAFVVQHGSKPRHTDVLELVARLNGAPNYNALVSQTGTLRDNALSRRVKGWLKARYASLGEVIEACRPGPAKPEGRTVPEALYQVMVAAGAGVDDERTANRRIAERLHALARDIAEMENEVYRAAGFNRVREIPADHTLVSVAYQMYNDEYTDIELRVDGNQLLLSYEGDEELVERIVDEGVVAEAIVHYPRPDRYGVPLEATEQGCREYLWGEGFTLAADFRAYGENAGDDSMMYADLAIAFSPTLMAALRERLAQDSSEG